jgi:hypothetical protein
MISKTTYVALHVCAFLFLLFALCKPSNSQAQNDSLIANSCLVFSGKAESIVGPNSGDLGTEFYHVKFQVDSIYKQCAFIDREKFSIWWEVSNLRCAEESMSECISKYSTGKWIFYLDLNNVVQGGELLDSNIVPFSSKTEQAICNLVHEQKIKIEHYEADAKCHSDCTFCPLVEGSNWNKVEKYVKRQIKKNGKQVGDAGWMYHRSVKWSYSDRIILASLPSYSSTRMRFLTEKGQVEALLRFQIGYYKIYTPWIPHVLYKLFNAQTYSAFSVENVDSLILLSIHIDSSGTRDIVENTKKITLPQIRDSVWTEQYGPAHEVSDELILLDMLFSDLFLQMNYQMDRHSAEYVSHFRTYIDSLKSHKQIYRLALFASHSHPEISIHALKALDQLNDKRVLTFLLDYALHQYIIYSEGILPYDMQAKHYTTLITTMDHLTGVTTLNPMSNLHVPSISAMEYSLPLWKNQFELVGSTFELE